MKIKLTLLIALSIIILCVTPWFAMPVDAEFDRQHALASEIVTEAIIDVTTSDINEITDVSIVIDTTTIINNNIPIDKYAIATKIWNRLKAEGFNDYICAGIMGNIMAEVGGQTLDFSEWKYWSTGKYSGSYGICQWTQGRKKKLLTNFGSDIDAQLDFLIYEIAYEFNTYGNKYKKGFNYEAFCNLTNYHDAALAFAKCYERCGSGSYNVRKRNAEKAYSYFVK